MDLVFDTKCPQKTMQWGLYDTRYGNVYTQKSFSCYNSTFYNIPVCCGVGGLSALVVCEGVARAMETGMPVDLEIGIYEQTKPVSYET